MTITTAQRQTIRQQAGHCCEYCRVEEDGRMSRLHVDHIISLKHGGTDGDDNLCQACYKCNGYKGSNVAGIDPETDQASKLFHPRKQVWDEHFKINPDATLTGLTPEGRVTILVLRMNDSERVHPRYLAKLIDEYPCT